MKKVKAVVVGLIMVVAIAAADWADSVMTRDQVSPIDHSSSKDAFVDLIFADGFESGDTSAWNYEGDGACMIATIDLPMPARRE